MGTKRGKGKMEDIYCGNLRQKSDWNDPKLPHKMVCKFIQLKKKMQSDECQATKKAAAEEL